MGRHGKGGMKAAHIGAVVMATGVGDVNAHSRVNGPFSGVFRKWYRMHPEIVRDEGDS